MLNEAEHRPLGGKNLGGSRERSIDLARKLPSRVHPDTNDSEIKAGEAKLEEFLNGKCFARSDLACFSIHLIVEARTRRL